MKQIDPILIQRYLDGDLTEEEKLAVESQLQLPSVQEYLDTYRTIADGIRHYGEQQVCSEVEQLEAEAQAVEAESYPQPIARRWFLRGAAASLLLLLVAFPVYWQQDERRLPRLANEYFKPYEALGGATRGSNDEGFVLPEAFEAYFQKDYPQAIELFTQASTQEDRPYVWLYLGNAYLSDEQPQEAVKALKRVLTYPDVDRRTEQRTHWYLGLAYLKLINKDAATRHFTLLEDTEDYGPPAQDILKSIY